MVLYIAYTTATKNRTKAIQEVFAMRTTNHNIYISDLLSAPTPRRAGYHMDYQRREALNQLIWRLLPGLIQGLLLIVLGGVCVFGLMALTLGFGG